MSALEHDDRPWGCYDVLSDEADSKVKRITVRPGCRLSYQRHAQRSEHWFLVSGAGVLTLGVPAGLRTHAPWLLGGVKSTSYAVNMAALRVAAAAGLQDAVFVSSDGEVLEAPTATCAWVRGGQLVTPPPEGVAILPGTTMDVVLELCGELGVPYEVRRGSVEELRGADEVLLTGSIRGVAPVVELDGRALPVGDVTRRLRDAFEERVRA